MTVKRPQPETKRLNLTKKTVEALRIPADKRYSVYDTQVRGLGVLCQPTGHKSFFWFRKVRGYPTWMTIGNFPDLTVEQARTRAAEHNAKLARWKADNYEGDNPFKQRRDLTLGQLLADYVERQVKPHAANPERAVPETEGKLTYFPAWKDRRLSAIRRADVLRLHQEIGEKRGKVIANRVVQFLRTLLNWAVQAELWRGENPAAKIKPFHEEKRTRFLQPDELPRLFAALKREPQADLRDFILLDILTGVRKADLFAMRWENVSLDENRWEVPRPKNRKAYLVPLMPEAIEILKARLKRRVEDNAWVFPSHGKTGHLTGFKRSWPKLRQRAKISDVTIHDLRRTLGSWQAAQGTSLKIIGESLGHSSTAATQIYARLNLDPVRASVAAATQAMLAAAKKKPKLLRGPRG